jgi:L-amino acid N-acyltransferase YncA
MFDFVARERKFLAFLKAPPLEAISQFILNNIKERYPQFVVLSAGAVVGWCDVTPDRTRLTYAHRGTLGIGLLPEFRGKGVGGKLMQRTLDGAFKFGLTRIELTAREK